MLKGKTVLLGVTGSIAAYKIAGLASMLVKQHADVTVLMTRNATNFIHPTTFETLTGNKCLIDTFDRNFQFSVEHVAIAKRADVVLVAPASANVIGKIANGIADDMLTTTVMACACRCPILLAPAMNTNMFENPIVQDNLQKLRRFGYTVIEPDSGYLACGDTGRGKMPSEQVLFDWILREIACEKDLAGKRVVVTAGATAEKIDPVRFITNHSTGRMGCAVARRAMLRGAAVTLVCGRMAVEPPPFVEVVRAESAAEMFEAVKAAAQDADIVVKAAAVADYRPKTVGKDEKAGRRADARAGAHDGHSGVARRAQKAGADALRLCDGDGEPARERGGKAPAQEPRPDCGEQPPHARRGLRRRYERRDAPDGNGGRDAAAAFEGRDGGPHFG